MASEKKTFEPHAGHTVMVHRGDGSTIGGADGLKPGEQYSTSDPQEILLLEQAEYVKAATGDKPKAKD